MKCQLQCLRPCACQGNSLMVYSNHSPKDWLDLSFTVYLYKSFILFKDNVAFPNNLYFSSSVAYSVVSFQSFLNKFFFFLQCLVPLLGWLPQSRLCVQSTAKPNRVDFKYRGLENLFLVSGSLVINSLQSFELICKKTRSQGLEWSHKSIYFVKL